MLTRTRLVLTIACSLGLIAASRSMANDDVLADVSRLYQSASYEDALKILSTNATSVDADRRDEYEALCLLALGRTRDAEQPLERLVARKPKFTFNPNEFPPRLVALHRTVRRRLLPALLRSSYDTARVSFDHDQFAA